VPQKPSIFAKLNTLKGSIMSTAVDNFNRQLHHKLEEVEDQAKSLKESMQSSAKKTRSEIQEKLDSAKTKLNAKKQEFDEYRLKLKTQFRRKRIRSEVRC
jgi:ABC-type phosphate transport system auxiliary subunit